MYKSIIRHGPYDKKHNLTQEGAELSKEKGSEIRTIIGDVKDKEIEILSSNAPRAEETAENIAKGLGVKTNIHIINGLWDDSDHIGDIEEVFNFIKNLPPHLVQLIITHKYFAYRLAKKNGFSGKDKDLGYLGSFDFEDSEEQTVNIENEIIDISSFDLEEPLNISMKIPVGDEKTIGLIKSIATLQKERGYFIEFEDHNNIKLSFIVPEITPVDPEKAMRGDYDRDGYLPVTIKTDGEEYLRKIIRNDYIIDKISREQFESYKNQLIGLKIFISSMDNSINPNEWIVNKKEEFTGEYSIS